MPLSTSITLNWGAWYVSISLNKGSDYRYAWPDAIQIKGSVCHSNGVDLVA